MSYRIQSITEGNETRHHPQRRILWIFWVDIINYHGSFRSGLSSIQGADKIINNNKIGPIVKIHNR